MKYLLILILRNLLKVFNIFPISENRIIFTSYNGKQYSCNPKYIYENLLEEKGNLELIWAFNDVDDFHLEKNTIKVKYKSILYIYYVMTSKIVIENSESWSIIPKRKNQIVINTWHGGGAYKKVGKERKDARSFNEKNVQYKNKRVDTYISSSKAFTQQTLRDSFGFRGEVLEIGMPRNDIFFQKDSNFQDEIKEKLKVQGYKLVLVAPTFRNKLNFSLDTFDFERLLNSMRNRFGGEWLILYRSHYYDTSDTSRVIRDNILDVSQYPDMQELLLISDVLVTDFSSSMWDFSLMKKPVFLYAPDLKDYEQHERGFYTRPDSWPFLLSTDFEGFINNILTFDFDKYEYAVLDHHKKLGSREKGIATKKTVQYIKKVIPQYFDKIDFLD